MPSVKSKGSEVEKSIEKNHLDELINKINQTNQYFLGVKLNTNYLKINKVVLYEDVSKYTNDKFTITDLPFEITTSKEAASSFESCNEAAVLKTKAAQILFSHGRVEQTRAKIQ